MQLKFCHSDSQKQSPDIWNIKNTYQSQTHTNRLFLSFSLECAHGQKDTTHAHGSLPLLLFLIRVNTHMQYCHSTHDQDFSSQALIRIQRCTRHRRASLSSLFPLNSLHHFSPPLSFFILLSFIVSDMVPLSRMATVTCLHK